jgi:hypothetical protein
MSDGKKETRIVSETQVITVPDFLAGMGGITTRMVGSNGEYVEAWGRTAEISHENALKELQKK